MYTSRSGEQQLRRLGLNIDRAALRAYTAYREEELTEGSPTDHAIARDTSCSDISPLLAKNLSKQLRSIYSRVRRSALGKSGLQAFIEFHDHEDLEFDHTYVLLGSRNPDDDIVVDGSYQQFLHHDAQQKLPLVFVGTREEAQNLMGEHAVDPNAARFYGHDTLDISATLRTGAEAGLTHPRL